MTVYGVIDTLAKVGFGAAISVVGAVVVARFQHKSDRRRESIERKRQLLERLASELAAYMVGPTALAHVATLYGRGRADEQRLTQTFEALIVGYEHLTNAIYVAALVGERQLIDALGRYWDAANAVYCEVRRSGNTVNEARLSQLLLALSKESQATRLMLGEAFAAI